MRVDEYESDKSHIYGRVKSGDFGNWKEIYNTESGKVEGTIEEHHSEELPLFFHYVNLDHPQKDLVILQQYGRFGAKTVFEQALNEFLEDDVSRDVKVDLKRFVSGELWKELKNADRVKEIDATVHEESYDDMGKYVDNYNPKKTSLTIKPDKGKGLDINIDRIKKSFKKNKDNGSINYVELGEHKAEEIQFKCEINGSTKSLYLNRSGGKFRESMVVGDEVKMKNASTPYIDSIKQESGDYADKISEQIERNNS